MSLYYYRTGSNHALQRCGLKTAAAAVEPNTVGENFVAGLDPFGFITSQYGQRSEQAGLSDMDHAARMGANVAGGIVGSGLMLPMGISGLVTGATEFAQTPGHIGRRALAAGKGLWSGAKMPIHGVYDGLRIKRFLTQAANAPGNTVVPQHIRRSAANLADVTPVSALTGSINPEMLQSVRKLDPLMAAGGAVGAAAKSHQLIKTKSITPEMAEQLLPTASSSLNSGLAILGVGGAVGAAGAGINYHKGREAERDFRVRLQDR